MISDRDCLDDNEASPGFQDSADLCFGLLVFGRVVKDVGREHDFEVFIGVLCGNPVEFMEGDS